MQLKLNDEEIQIAAREYAERMGFKIDGTALEMLDGFQEKIEECELAIVLDIKVNEVVSKASEEVFEDVARFGKACLICAKLGSDITCEVKKINPTLERTFFYFDNIQYNYLAKEEREIVAGFWGETKEKKFYIFFDKALTA